MTIAVYPGSFDPITNGHLDIATRSAKLFDKLIIGVYDTPNKHLLFTTKERTEMVRQAVVDLPNVEGKDFSWGFVLWGVWCSIVLFIGLIYIRKFIKLDFDWEKDSEQKD